MATNLIASIKNPAGDIIAEGDSSLLAVPGTNKDLSAGEIHIRVASLLEGSPVPPMFLVALRSLTLVLRLEDA